MTVTLMLVPPLASQADIPAPRLPRPESPWGSPDLKMAVACLARGWSPADLAVNAPGVAAEMRGLLKLGVTRQQCRDVLGWDAP